MINQKVLFGLLAAASLALAGTALAGAKTYQVTGTVAEVTPTKVTLQKGTEKWEIDLDPATQGSGNLKVGARVTITYTMNAAKIDAGALPKIKAAVEEVAPITSGVAPGAQKKEEPPVSPSPTSTP
jgi:cytochrome c1